MGDPQFNGHYCPKGGEFQQNLQGEWYEHHLRNCWCLNLCVSQQSPMDNIELNTSQTLVDIGNVISLRADIVKNCQHKIPFSWVWPIYPDPVEIKLCMQNQQTIVDYKTVKHFCSISPSHPARKFVVATLRTLHTNMYIDMFLASSAACFGHVSDSNTS